MDIRNSSVTRTVSPLNLLNDSQQISATATSHLGVIKPISDKAILQALNVHRSSYGLINDPTLNVYLTNVTKAEPVSKEPTTKARNVLKTLVQQELISTKFHVTVLRELVKNPNNNMNQTHDNLMKAKDSGYDGNRYVVQNLINHVCDTLKNVDAGNTGATPEKIKLNLQKDLGEFFSINKDDQMIFNAIMGNKKV